MKWFEINCKTKTTLHKKLITKSRTGYIYLSTPSPSEFTRPDKTILTYNELGVGSVYTLFSCKNFFYVSKTLYGTKVFTQQTKSHFYIKTMPSVASLHIQMTYSETRSGCNQLHFTDMTLNTSKLSLQDRRGYFSFLVSVL